MLETSLGSLRPTDFRLKVDESVNLEMPLTADKKNMSFRNLLSLDKGPEKEHNKA